MMNLITKALLAATIATATAGTATAATINVDKQVSTSIWKSTENATYWGIGTDIEVSGTVRNNVGAGAFQVESSDFDGTVKKFIAFCLEPLEYLKLSIPYEMGSNFSATINDRLNVLANNALGLVTDKYYAAAFQMAAWELVTEVAGPFSLTDGDFKVIRNNYASDKAEGYAQDWLESISNGSWVKGATDYMILNADGTQDLLTDIPTEPGGPVVPLPAGGILLLSALGAGAVAARRRKTA